MKKITTVIATAILALNLTACGGSASDSLSSSPAKYASAFKIHEYDCPSPSGPTNPLTGQPLNPDVIIPRYNGLLFDDNNTAYRLCNTQLWVGQFSGTINSGGAAGSGGGKLTIYESGKGPIGTTENLSGTILTADGYVSMIDFRDSAGSSKSTFQTDLINTALNNSITKTYATLAGSYKSDDVNTTLSIQNDGTITGTSSLGVISGQITRFNGSTQVHNVAVTFTPAGGAPMTLTGVLGPYNASVMLAVAGSGIAYAKVFFHN